MRPPMLPVLNNGLAKRCICAVDVHMSESMSAVRGRLLSRGFLVSAYLMLRSVAGDGPPEP